METEIDIDVGYGQTVLMTNGALLGATASVRIGVLLHPASTDLRRCVDAAEDLGFADLGCGEHLLFHGPTPNSFARLAFAAARTQRIGLVSSIVPVALYPPALLAKLVAELDMLSGGRYVFGVGAAGEYPPEFAAVGVPVNRRGKLTDEGIDTVRRLLGEVSALSGAVPAIEDVHDRIQPVGPSGPAVPIWVAGRSDAAIKRAVRVGDVWFPYLVLPQQLRDGIDTARRLSAEAGVTPPTAHCGVFINTGPDVAAAENEAMHFVSNLYQVDFTGARRNFLIAGSPETCAQRLQELIDSGAQGLMLVPACGPERWPDVVEHVASNVTSHLKPRDHVAR